MPQDAAGTKRLMVKLPSVGHRDKEAWTWTQVVRSVGIPEERLVQAVFDSAVTMLVDLPIAQLVQLGLDIQEHDRKVKHNAN